MKDREKLPQADAILIADAALTAERIQQAGLGNIARFKGGEEPLERVAGA